MWAGGACTFRVDHALQSGNGRFYGQNNPDFQSTATISSCVSGKYLILDVIQNSHDIYIYIYIYIYTILYFLNLFNYFPPTKS